MIGIEFVKSFIGVTGTDYRVSIILGDCRVVAAVPRIIGAGELERGPKL